MNSVSFQGSSRIRQDTSVMDDDSSIGLNNSVFNMKIVQKKSHLADQTGHEVILNVTFALAVPGVFTALRQNESFSTRTSLSDPYSRNVQLFYHLEFDLFSKSITKESYKTDVGFYGLYAKIYPDKSDSRVIPTWTDGEDTWISWIQHYRIWVTDHHVRDLTTHKMKVTIWDTKDKCQPKVRFDRPKPPKSASKSKSTNENVSWIKQTVLMISKQYSLSSAYRIDNDRILPHQIVTSQPVKRNIEKSNPKSKSAKTVSTAKSSLSSPDISLKQNEPLILYGKPKSDANSRLESFGLLEKLLEPSQGLSVEKTKPFHRNSDVKAKPLIGNLKEPVENHLNLHVESNLRSESRRSVISQADNDNYNKNGRVNLEISLPDLFLQDNTLNRIPNSTSTLEDMFCRVSVESEILSSEQKQRLNPLAIKIRKITNYPITNETMNEINKRYKPVYCEYQFSDLQRYRTVDRIHDRTINFDDVSIILIGEMEEIKIKEQLINTFFTIQVFNRNKQDGQETDNLDKSDFFNVKTECDIGDINLTSACKTVTVFQTPKPQGESKIDLSDIVNKNLKFLEVSVPVTPVSAMSVKEDNENQTNHTKEDQINFLEAETAIKLSFQLVESLSLKLSSCKNEDYFTRLVVINNCPNLDFIRVGCANHILQFNCESLNFQSQNINEKQTFLFNMKNLTSEKNNAFVGFYALDKVTEILFVEGHQTQMKSLHNHCSNLLNKLQNDSISLKILYNDSLHFKEKQKFPILTMIPLVLSKEISFFASQPLLYVRDILPKNCVEGICRLKNLILADSLQVAVRNNLIPTYEMIEDLSQYLCSHIESKTENNAAKYSENRPRKLERKQIKTAPVTSDRKDIKQEEKLRTKTDLSVNYVYADNDCGFHYSVQNKNGISSALKNVRQKMDPKRRYTFSQEYLFSGSVDPVDLNDVYMAEERKLKSEPRWVNKGTKKVIEDYAEVMKIPPSRISDLKEPWIDNELHVSYMQPTLPERDQVDHYFDTYIRPLNLLDRDSISIMPSYVIQKLKENETNKIEYEAWKKKICVANPRLYVHRLLPQTELTERGRKSSHQIAKLKGLRKDNLRILNCVYRKFGDPNEISPINTTPNEEASNACYTVGGEFDRNLSVNFIPVQRKDKDFKPVYQPGKEIPVFKNPHPRITYQNQSPFAMPC